jgi:hypothetical protein
MNVPDSVVLAACLAWMRAIAASHPALRMAGRQLDEAQGPKAFSKRRRDFTDGQHYFAVSVIH